MPPADPGRPLPIHEQISQVLRSRIRSGELPVGSRLPAEADLMAEFDVARGTVRRALRTLGEQGIVQTLRGKGTYVRSGRPDSSIGQTLVGLGEALSYSGKNLSTVVLQKAVIPAVDYPAFPALVDESEQFLALDRVRYLDGVPVARLKNWVRTRLAPGVEETNFRKTALFTALDRCAVERISSGRRTFSAVLPDGDVAESLNISEVVPLLFLSQVTYLDGGEIIEYSDVWMDSQHITVAANLTR